MEFTVEDVGMMLAKSYRQLKSAIVVFFGGMLISIKVSLCIRLLVLLRFCYTVPQEWVGCYAESGQPNIPI